LPLSNLEVHWLVRELQCIVGTHFNRIADMESGWKLKFGNFELIADVPDRLYLTTRKQNAIEPRGLTQYCRAHLHGKVKRVWQPGFDRVVAIELDTGQSIVFELFSNGNLVLVSNGITEKAFREEEWKDRAIRRGKPYSFPNSGKLDPREMTLEQFNALFTGKDVIHSLLAGINMAGRELELACLRAGVDKASMTLTPGQRPGLAAGDRLYEEIKALLGAYEPGLSPLGAVAVHWPGEAFEPRASLSEALDESYSHIVADTSSSDKVMRKIASQERAVGELAAKADGAKAKGDAVYEHWTELEALLQAVEKMKESGLSRADINKKLAGKATVNEKTGKITVKA